MTLAETLAALRSGYYKKPGPAEATLARLAQALPYPAFVELAERVQEDGTLRFGEHTMTVNDVLDLESSEL